MNLAGFARFVRLRLCLLVAAATFTGYVLRSLSLDWPGLWAVAGAGILAAACSGLNQIQERQEDALMRRTRGRPLPSGIYSLGLAFCLVFGLGLSGLFLLDLAGFNPLILGLGVVVVYNGLYTPLKKITALSVLIGGISGSAPPLIGWCAAGGEITDFPALSLALVLYLWQTPHFWLLAERRRQEYLAAGFSLPDFRISGQGRVFLVWLACLGLAMLLTSAFAPSGPGLSLLAPLGLFGTMFAAWLRPGWVKQREFGLLNVCLGLWLAGLSAKALL